MQVHPKFSREQLEAAFSAVQHPVNWKFGNRLTIKSDALEVTQAATVFFAGSPVTVEAFTPDGAFCTISFKGYYHCIGA